MSECIQTLLIRYEPWQLQLQGLQVWILSWEYRLYEKFWRKHWLTLWALRKGSSQTFFRLSDCEMGFLRLWDSFVNGTVFPFPYVHWSWRLCKQWGEISLKRLNKLNYFINSITLLWHYTSPSVSLRAWNSDEMGLPRYTTALRISKIN